MLHLEAFIPLIRLSITINDLDIMQKAPHAIARNAYTNQRHPNQMLPSPPIIYTILI